MSERAAPGAGADPVVLRLPFDGTWLAQNSPARRVPSHGSHLFATTYAIDFVAVRGRRTAAVRDWRTLFGTEPPERFLAFGRPILAPADGRVVAVHDGEPDHEARRSQPSLVAYALTQGARRRRCDGRQPRRPRAGRRRVRPARPPAGRVDRGAAG